MAWFNPPTTKIKQLIYLRTVIDRIERDAPHLAVHIAALRKLQHHMSPATTGKLDADPRHHARTGAADTSHEAAASVDITKQARQVLGAYSNRDDITDHEAYFRAGLAVAINGARSRCTDLRRAGFIEIVGRGPTPSGRAGHLCRITSAGEQYLTGAS